MLKFKHVINSVKLWFFTLFFISISSFGQDNCQEYENKEKVDLPFIDVICDNGGLLFCQYEQIINVPYDYPLTDVNITVDIDYSYNPGLNIYLKSPSGTTVTLSRGKGGWYHDDYNKVTFDDASSNTLPNGSYSKLEGTYHPEGNLSDFNGEYSKGDWTLIVRVVDGLKLAGVVDLIFGEGEIKEVTLNHCYDLGVVAVTEGYKGPGGIGHTDGASPLVLWTKPEDITEEDNDLFAKWTDASGYGSHLEEANASYQPKIK